MANESKSIKVNSSTKFLGIQAAESITYDYSSDLRDLNENFVCRWVPGNDEYMHLDISYYDGLFIEIPGEFPIKFLGDESKISYDNTVVALTYTNVTNLLPSPVYQSD